jgi:hypothetical protein
MRRKMDEFDGLGLSGSGRRYRTGISSSGKLSSVWVPTGHSWTNGRPDPPGKSDYDQAEALATVAIALSLGEPTAEVRRLIEVVERRGRR